MAKFEITFDPTYKPDVKDVFKYLHKLYPEIPEDYSKLTETVSWNTSNLAETIRKYTDKAKELEESKEELQKQLDESSNQITSLNEQLQEDKRQIDQLTEDRKKLIEEREKLHNEYNSLCSKFDSIQNQQDTLKKENENLRKKYEEASLNGEISLEKFFAINGEKLSESNAYDEPFIGKVDSFGNASFTFNIEKGKVQHFCQNISELEPFCEISGKAEGANVIKPGKWGEGQYKDGEILVTKKAEIKLSVV